MTVRTISSAVTGSVTFGTYGTITVTSLGSVTATGTAIVDTGVLINSGTITGTDIGVDVSSVWSVTNLAQATISGGVAGVYGVGTITNAGTISGGSAAGVAVRFTSATGNLLAVDPGGVFIGTVAGGGAGNTLRFASGASQGTFAGLGSHYASFTQVSIDAGANWLATGVNVVAAGETLAEVGYLYSTGTFTNAGLVTPMAAFGITQRGGTFANDGQISVAGSIGILVNTGGVVTNAATGDITGASSEGVSIGPSGTLVNAGTISGGKYGGVYSFGGLVTNLAGGTIAGATYAFGGTRATLVNAGTIRAAGTTDDAVHFRGGANDRVVVDPGAVFVGTVNGFNAIGSAYISTLEFASGASGGTFAGLGSQYVNFAQVSVDAGAQWTANGANTIASGETLADSGKLTFAAAPVGAGLVTLVGHGVMLASDGGASIGPSIGGLVENTLELVGTVEGFAGLTGNSLTLSGGTALTLAGSYTAGQIDVTNDGANTFITACFASGTSIATARGAVAVEALGVGERVVTASGRLAPVAWIGFRRVDLARHARPFEVMPVRVRAGALGDGVPGRDLVLSPDHAVWVDGYLVPVRYLINGRSIVQECRDSVTYWHVELDRHDLVLAEGVACESYLDTGNRGAFENGADAMQLHPGFGREHALAVWQAASCAPILFDPAEPALRARHLRLMVRAERLARAA